MILSNHQKSFTAFSRIILCILTLFFSSYGYAQSLTNKLAWDKLMAIENDVNGRQLERALDLKKQFEDQRLVKDSVYARILHKIGAFQYNAKQLNLAIANTYEAIRINISGKKGSCKKYVTNSYINLALFYNNLMLLDKALICYDSAMLLALHYPDMHQDINVLRADKCTILIRKGDYEKYVEEATIGQLMAQKDLDTFFLVIFSNHKAQGNLYQDKIIETLKDAEKALQLARQFNYLDEEATSLKLKASVAVKQKNIPFAISLFRNSIQVRIKTGLYEKVADDYVEFGNFFLQNKDYYHAKECYLKVAEYANKANDKERLSKAHVNSGLVNFYQHNYKAAEENYIKALRDLGLNTGESFLHINTSGILTEVANTDLMFAILTDKTELLLHYYKESNNKKYLDACLATALVTDSVITKARFDLSGEQSKLYWRNHTREFFTNVIEACYLANKPDIAFYFMEKSRAVLLNDKLNELGASIHLPISETNKEQGLRVSIIEEQQKLQALADSGDKYIHQQEKLYQANIEFGRFIKSLEQKYPAYFQYKYDDKVPSLEALKQWLAVNNQTFVHYFMNDTVAYVLCITPVLEKFIKISKEDFKSDQLQKLLQICSDHGSLNRNYSTFISLSNAVYKLLFQPLQIPKGRIIICPDNFLIPFEALCTDNTGRHFLLNDYAFSYVYSARYLMKKFTTNDAKGNFIGFAPVTFQSYLKAAELSQSAMSLEKCAAYYTGAKLFINKNATRSNFLKSISDFKVVNLFSHANANTTGNNEPFLLMQDSMIKLSELQVLENHAISLVILSACETNIGKSATGEGIYSLARGFSAAGIPSVVATLWNSDEHAVYAISEKFHEYLSQGIPKDQALQKARLYFIQHSDPEKQLPFYWANMIITGNTSPIDLLPGSIITSSYSKSRWLLITGIIAALLLISVLMLKRIRSDKLIHRLKD